MTPHIHAPCHPIERFIRKLISGHWRQNQMELLVSILHNGHRHASRYIDALSLQGGSRVGDQFGLEGRVTPCLGDDFCEVGGVLRHGLSFGFLGMAAAI